MLKENIGETTIYGSLFFIIWALNSWDFSDLNLIGLSFNSE